MTQGSTIAYSQTRPRRRKNKVMHKESTLYFDKNNREIFVSDRYFSEQLNQFFVVGVTEISSQSRKQYFLLSDNKRINLGIGASKDMHYIKPKFLQEKS